MKNQYKKIILFCPRTGAPAAVSVAEAAAITGRTAPAPEVPWFWSDQYDAKM